MIFVALFMLAMSSYQANPPKQDTPVSWYRPDGTTVRESADRIDMPPIVCDSVYFNADDSTATIQLTKNPLETVKRTAPSAANRISVVGGFEIKSYNAKTAKVTIKALSDMGTGPRTVILVIQ